MCIYTCVYSGKRQDFGRVLVHFLGSRLESRGGVWGGEMGSLRPAPPPCLTPSSGPRADHAGTSWRSWTSSWSQDCRISSLCCRRMMPRWPNIAQDSITMSKQWLREGPTRPPACQNPSKSLYCRSFLEFVDLFIRSRPRSRKVTLELLKSFIWASKLAILVTFWRQDRQLSGILAPSWRILAAKLAPKVC